MTRVRNSEARMNRKTIVELREFNEILEVANQISEKYYRLRARAILVIFFLTGKRRGEVARLEISDIQLSKTNIILTFTLLKKRKKGPLLSKRSTPKTISLSDPLTGIITEYLEYLKKVGNGTKYLLPRTRTLFGKGYMIIPEHHITGRQVFNIIRGLSEVVWPHLFRETAAADIIKQDPTLIGATRVKNRLDLEDIRTGMAYLRRFAADIIRRSDLVAEEKKDEWREVN